MTDSMHLDTVKLLEYRRIYNEKNYEEMSKTVMYLLLGKMYENRPMHIAITAGSTPKRMYEMLSQEIKNKRDFKNVTFYNFDEVPYKNTNRDDLTLENLKKDFFNKAGISANQIHPLTLVNYQTHDELLESIGGLDAIFMGLGAEGHFCGNTPDITKFANKTSKFRISASYKTLFASEMGGIEFVPDEFVAMGPVSVLASKETYIFVSGKAKATIVRDAFFGPVTEQVPASIFQLHPNFTLVLDQEAASEIHDLI